MENPLLVFDDFSSIHLNFPAQEFFFFLFFGKTAIFSSLFFYRNFFWLPWGRKYISFFLFCFFFFLINVYFWSIPLMLLKKVISFNSCPQWIADFLFFYCLLSLSLSEWLFFVWLLKGEVGNTGEHTNGCCESEHKSKGLN